ncbi:ParB family protein [Methyloterricola oryzae]|uniref:ParB family protein n=1 Tax=Methyloterricola oryzae TaxID=1495050 RepID=UPI0005EBB729|nr:ParB family protein [Methyloterricola oryzae]
MAKKTADIKGLLLEGHFGPSRSLPISEPIALTSMVVDIDKIKPYDRNPRREPNHVYAQIKASIRSRGMDAPLRITRRPGEELYIIAAGGNTRLAILKELWGETGNPQFRQVHCLFAPWNSESEVLSGHLVENELRGDLLLIDKAMALLDLREQIETEEGHRLTRSEFLRRLDAIGYHVSRRQMARYEYACEVLEPVIPIALRGEEGSGGMSGRDIDRIHDLENAYRAFFSSVPEHRRPALEPLWADALAQRDDLHLSLNLEGVRRVLDQRIATLIDEAAHVIAMGVDALLYNGSEWGEAEEAAAPSVTDSRDQTDAPTVAAAGVPSTASPEELYEVEPESGGSNGFRSNEDQEADHVQDDQVGADGKQSGNFAQPDDTVPMAETSELAAAAESIASSSVSGPDDDDFLNSLFAEAHAHLPKENDLKSLRSRCFIIALRIGNAFGLDGLIQAAPAGLGFFVDLPTEMQAKAIECDEAAWCAWWWLFGLSEQTLSVERTKLAPADFSLCRLLEDGEDDENRLFELVGLPASATLLPHYLLSSPKPSDSTFRDLLLLAESCRTLKKVFSESLLWHCPTLEQLRDWTK